MLFDVEDYAWTMRALTNDLHIVNNHFNLGLTLPNPANQEGYLIPTAEMMIEINQELQTKEPWEKPDGTIYGGSDGKLFLEYTFEDFSSTARATRDSVVNAVRNYFSNILNVSKDATELESKWTAMNDFLDANIALGQPWFDFWSACYSFYAYGKGYAEGDVLPNKEFGYWDDFTNTSVQAPVKFKIMTQEIYDNYFAALVNFMEKVKAVMIEGGLEA
jgi:hypothetical protein